MPKKYSDLPRGIDRLHNGQYRARIYTQGRRHTIGSFFTIGDARAALSIARGEIARGIFIPPAEVKAERRRAADEKAKSAVTIDTLADEWFTFLERAGRSRGTIYTYQSRYNTHIRPVFGEVPVTVVTPAEVEDWYSDLLREKGSGVARNVYLTLSALFTYATGKAKGQSATFTPLISENPCGVPGATKHQPKHDHDDGEKVATPEQVAALVSNMPPRYALAVNLAAWSALRLGEVIALRRRDMSTAVDGTLWIRIVRQVQARGSGLYETRPKSEAGTRSVPIPPALTETVNDHLREHVGRKRDMLLFPRTPKGDDWIHPNTLRNAFNAAVETYNDSADPDDRLDGFTFHALRHTALTRIGQAGATLEELKRFAGHTSAEVVAKYQHATRDRLAMLASSLSSEVRNL